MFKDGTYLTWVFSSRHFHICSDSILTCSCFQGVRIFFKASYIRFLQHPDSFVLLASARSHYRIHISVIDTILTGLCP
ncbi:hypothetical protein M408DRAFT_290423 [Serendipita vermifera MAFF 305830]|uniref:Uncharacterized protein n=1 Tax=Serendipita vermifera MAFF 305830 TaxID=933852 RepID=A0A0C3AQR7_SERVB|nr:hypothetical protein M408DRAFT_290423 [Serendipita vermifera MAFF 305830]